MSKGSSVNQSIKILKWAIENKKTLTEACRYFQVSERYLRSTREMLEKKSKNSESVKWAEEFLRLYTTFLGKEANTITKNELLGKNDIITKEETRFLQDTGILDARGMRHVKTLGQLLGEAKVDMRLWEVSDHVVNKWDVTTGEGNTYQNWQVKAWLKKRVEIETAIKFEDFYRELLSKHDPLKYKSVSYPKDKEANLLEINIFDLHLGKLCWGEETNNKYDMKIASRRFNEALHDLLHRAGTQSYDRILFPIGNDFFNSDSHIGTTTEGTRQDEDSRWQKAFRRGKELLIEGIDYMRQFAPVDIVVIPGNHDWTKSFFLGETLAAWYRNDENVKVDNRATPRKYYLYGKVLLGFTHGDKEHNGSLRMLMANEAPKEWARSKYREFHCGHWHRKVSYKDTIVTKVPLSDEQLGITIRHMSSLAGTDAWHMAKGYVGPIKAAEAFLWNDQYGLVGQFNSNIRK
jgi:hypothetical protein